MSPTFDLDKSSRKNREIIKVVGVGGGGNNALNHIISGGVKGVEFIAANTDHAHLELSEAHLKIALGKELTKGHGAGSDPEVGQKAAQESRDEIRAALEGADMVFIAAGMGGGTGTGASPVIANIARETGTLVVAVVTRPFQFEGARRAAYAADGIAKLKEEVDALIVIPNDRLLNNTDRRTSFLDAFKRADSVLHQAVQGVTELILHPGLINVDFADVRSVMKGAGAAIMGIGEGYGENRVAQATHNAIHSPLMETPMVGAKRVLFNVSVGPNVALQEISEAGDIIKNASDDDALTIWGHVFDPDMDDGVKITVIAAGFAEGSPGARVGSGASTIAMGEASASTDAKLQSRPISGTQQQDRVAPNAARSASPTSETENLFTDVSFSKLDEPSYLRRKKQ